MRWTHEVSAEWLRARRGVLSATDIVKLLPAYKRTLKKPPASGEIVPEFAAVWAEKHSANEPETAAPSSAAARGHIMEPWAVKALNEEMHPAEFHWDDAVIKHGLLGFSPDALDIMQPDGCCDIRILDARFMGFEDVKVRQPKCGSEIKSYDAAHHMKCILEDRMAHAELMQIAVAFAVVPSLRVMSLVYFCPGAPIEMWVERYEREELEEKIKLALDVALEYKRNKDILDVGGFFDKGKAFSAHCTEAEVWEQFALEQAEANGQFVLKR